MIIRDVLRSVLVVICSTGLALADGITVKDGRYADGPVIELRLTKGQSVQIQNHYQSGMEIHLTKAQQIQIKASTKVKVAPTKLMIFTVQDLEHDCTCFASNWAFPFKTGWLEIPIVWVCSDKEAEDNRATD